MKKLPSGNYNAQVRINGKVVSVTASTVAEVKRKIALLRCSKNDSLPPKIDFKSAMDNLLDAKSRCLSANTMKGYKVIARNLLPLYEMDVNSITQLDMQKFVNQYARTHSPKSVSNAYSFAMTVIKSVTPVSFSVKLPQKKRMDLPFPNIDEVKLLIDSAPKDLANSIRLIAFGPLRRGEACAIRYCDINGDTIHIHATITQDDGYEYKDTPKSAAGDRYITYPHEIIKALGKGKKTDYVLNMTPESMYMKFRRLCKRLGLPQYSIHSLRRFGASWLSSIGKSNAYIMKRGGWETESCLISCYRKNLQEDDDVLAKIKDFI